MAEPNPPKPSDVPPRGSATPRPRSSRQPRPTPASAATPARRPLPADGRLTVLLAGASGFIGTELRRQLAAAGHTVRRLVRRTPTAPDERSWDPGAGVLDHRLLEDVDAVVNLGGATLSRPPWTTRYRRAILDSRVHATRTLVGAMSTLDSPPPVFLSGSAVGIYGDRPGEALTEAAPRGPGFLGDVVVAWEAAAAQAPIATRTVLLRTGLVLGDGGALAPLRLATRSGLGARIGTGRQHWPWIGLHDEAAAIVHLLTSATEGAVNLAGPEPATADRITGGIARELRRPYLLRVPEPVVDLAAGDFGRELLLPSQRVVPQRLLDDGFVFRDATPEAALAAALARGD